MIHISKIVVTLLVLVVYLIIMAVKRNKDKNFRILSIFLLLYIIVLQIITIDDIIINNIIVLRRVKWIPFDSTLQYITQKNIYTFFYNVIGNIILFIPMGIFLKLYKFINKSYIVLISLFVSFSIELIQLTLCARIFDIDDIIYNVIGANVGYYLLKCFNKKI